MLTHLLPGVVTHGSDISRSPAPRDSRPGCAEVLDPAASDGVMEESRRGKWGPGTHWALSPGGTPVLLSLDSGRIFLP